MRNFTKYVTCFYILSLFSFHISAEIPAGYYYFARDKKGAELKTSLSEASHPFYVLNYGGGTGYTWEGFYKADQREDGSVWDMYSDIVRYFDGYKAVPDMHIEHSLPKSWWGGHVNYAYKDLFHLYPSDGRTNSTKNDLPLGEVEGTPTFDNGVSKVGKNGFGTTYTGNCFEPADEYKGDFARSYLYISTVYENFDHLWKSPMMDNNVYPVWKDWAIDLLIKWHEQDPVSEKELERNEVIFGIQGNRNPFIDYPELVDYIWGTNKDNYFPFPEGTDAFLVYPRRGVAIDFGVILENNIKTETVSLQGVNINSDITLALKGDSLFSLSTYTIPAATAVEGTDFTITFIPQFSGSVADTLLISGGGIEELIIPVKALASTDFIVLKPFDISPVGGVLQWISDADAEEYLVSLYQGDTKAGDLIISSYVEGSGYNKSIELYNGTGAAVDLSNYSLRLQSNGIGSFGNEYRLSGTLTNNSTYVITHKSCTNEELIAKSQVFTDNVMNFNGNDAVALYRNGVMIDIIGYADDGGEVMWGENVTLTRKPYVTHPITSYNADEWEEYPIDSFDKLGSHNMNFAAESDYIFRDRSVGNNNTYLVEELWPEKTYTYTVEAVMPDGSRQQAVNSTQIHTTGLEMPLALDATEIKGSSFIANWEETPYAAGYLLNVFQLEGSGSTTDINDFDDVGVNGQPLPKGWSGTASGNYTTTASSGKSPNSIALKNTGEYIQTKEYADPVSKLAFMYRFPSSGSGNLLTVEGLFGSNWQNIDSIFYVNTSKYYPEYNFTQEEEVKAFKFTFFKQGGNLAIDDIEISYGKFDTVYIKQNEAVTGSEMVITDLEEDQTYYYNLHAVLGDAVSPVSETIMVQTSIHTGNSTVEKNSPLVLIHKEGIIIKGLKGNEQINIYTVSGVCLYKANANTADLILPLNERGIYLINIIGQQGYSTIKVIK